MNERIHWTDEEQLQVALALVKCRQEDPVSPLVPMVKKAQLVLSEDRRRSGPPDAHFKTIRHTFADQWHKFVAKEPERVVVTLTKEVKVGYGEAIRHADMDVLIDEFTGRLARGLATKLVEAMANPVKVQSVVTRAVLQEEVRIKRVKVLVVGLMGDQERHVREKIGSLSKPVDLVFVPTDELSSVPTSVDYAIVTSHCNHNAWDVVGSALDKDKIFFVDTSITSIVQKIRDLAARQ